MLVKYKLFYHNIGFIFLIILILSISSCSSSKNFRNMNYLADSVTQDARMVQDFKVILQPGDRISIMVSALNPGAAQAFNIGSVSQAPSLSGDGGASGSSAQTGYLINEEGTIQFPQLGKLTVKGMTTQQVAETIQKALLQFLKDPIVNVTLINFKINVLGEVNRPGTITVQDGKMTVFEAISRSGDLTINGIRDNILVVREKDGKREFGKVYLASNNIFSSPFFYLQQGDIVYVSMNKNKLLLSDASQQRKFSIITLVFASISTIAIVFNALK